MRSGQARSTGITEGSEFGLERGRILDQRSAGSSLKMSYKCMFFLRRWSGYTCLQPPNVERWQAEEPEKIAHAISVITCFVPSVVFSPPGRVETVELKRSRCFFLSEFLDTFNLCEIPHCTCSQNFQLCPNLTKWEPP